MPEREFEYREGESRIFGRVRRPLITVEALSEVTGSWVTLDNVLADSGADLSILPSNLGEVVLRNPASGKSIEITGIVATAKLKATLHEVEWRLNGRRFKAAAAVAEVPDVPPVLGRVGALDLFEVRFIRGEKTAIYW